MGDRDKEVGGKRHVEDDRAAQTPSRLRQVAHHFRKRSRPTRVSDRKTPSEAKGTEISSFAQQIDVIVNRHFSENHLSGACLPN